MQSKDTISSRDKDSSSRPRLVLTDKSDTMNIKHDSIIWTSWNESEFKIKRSIGIF